MKVTRYQPNARGYVHEDDGTIRQATDAEFAEYLKASEPYADGLTRKEFDHAWWHLARGVRVACSACPRAVKAWLEKPRRRAL